MQSRIRKLYNVLVIGGTMAAAAGCTKADKDASNKDQAAPTQAKPAPGDPSTPAPAPTPQVPPTSEQPTPTEKAAPTPAATADPAAPATTDDKSGDKAKTVKKADKGKGSGVKGWS